MKKFLSLIVCIVLLCGCAPKTVTAKTENLSFTALFNVGGTDYECNCDLNENGDLSAEIIKPENIKGLKYIYSSNESEIEYLGIKYTLPKSSAYLAVTDKLSNILADLKAGLPANQNGEYIYKSGSDTVYFNKEGLIKSADIGGIKIQFANVKQG